jgi:NADPH:quinone reductase-like Zn-dependent oxidoreductase
MRALRYHEPGGPDVLRLEEVGDPDPGTHDVVVQVAACALNHLDVVQRHGWYQMPGFRYPHIAGMDVAGMVVAVGSEVGHAVAVGERVVIDPSLSGVPSGSRYAGMGDLYGELGIIGATVDGGYAELCVAPATHLYMVPPSMPLEHAATFPTVYLTASHALFRVGGLQAGESVLMHAAGSGVSTAAIQLACRAGATVLATAGTDEKASRAVDLGASSACNNRTTDVAAWAREVTAGRGVDMVLEHVGTALWEASLFSLAPQGRLVSCGNTSGDTGTIPSIGYLYHMGHRVLGSDPYRPDEFPPIWEQFCAGGFEVLIDSTFTLADGAEAQAKLLAGDVFGKILLLP